VPAFAFQVRLQVGQGMAVLEQVEVGMEHTRGGDGAAVAAGEGGLGDVHQGVWVTALGALQDQAAGLDEL
jgi:hypothetical protein